MIGWSRRSREDSERRARWWATLTEEQKRRYNERQAEVDRKFFMFAKVVLPILLVILAWTIARENHWV